MMMYHGPPPCFCFVLLSCADCWSLPNCHAVGKVPSPKVRTSSGQAYNSLTISHTSKLHCDHKLISRVQRAWQVPYKSQMAQIIIRSAQSALPLHPQLVLEVLPAAFNAGFHSERELVDRGSRRTVPQDLFEGHHPGLPSSLGHSLAFQLPPCSAENAIVQWHQVR